MGIYYKGGSRVIGSGVAHSSPSVCRRAGRNALFDEGRIAIKPVDIAGALACKEVFGDRCVTVFIRRNKEKIIQSLLERDGPLEDKVKRLMTLDSELSNEPLCDWAISNNGSLDHAVQQILRIVG